MHLAQSFAHKMARSAGVCLTMLVSLTLLESVILAQETATPKVNPATGTPVQGQAPPRPPRRIDTPYAQAAYAALQAPLDKLTPVTDEMLRNPPPGDWLNWRRTDNGWGYSPLTQINRKNVKDLKVAWKFTHDLPDDYPSLPGFYRTKRSLAIGGNKLIVGTIDMHVIALDVKTGKKVWDVKTDDYKSERTYNSGPLVVKDKVLIGAGNCGPGSANQHLGKVAGYSPPGGCFITGHDLETGKELWRFNLTAHSNEPGGDSWNNLPDDKRDGAAIWVAGQYDPELNLTYWGTGSPSPWSTITRGTFGADSLYVDSTVALNPDTGKLAWYYQHVPHDPYDQDYSFERIIVPVTVRGERHKAVITVGKPGIFEALDAATGKFLFALDPGAQNDLTSVDPVTGARTTLSEPAPSGVKNCPTGMGIRSFPAGAYSPLTNRYYMPIDDYCMGKMGDTPSRFLALDVNTQKLVWDIRTRVPVSSAVLTTAGGLVFAATPDRYFRAFDDHDGKVLWESPRLNDIPNAFPITYMVDGKQYIAMPAGDPGLQGNFVLSAAPELGAVRGSKSSVLWVWELP
jgi:alcohol dehydrogenase (cytochrome c)